MDFFLRWEMFPGLNYIHVKSNKVSQRKSLSLKMKPPEVDKAVIAQLCHASGSAIQVKKVEERREK